MQFKAFSALEVSRPALIPLTVAATVAGTAALAYAFDDAKTKKPPPPPTLKTTVIHKFTGGKDGAGPNDGFLADSSGAVYGTTVGFETDFGTVFKLTPPAGKNGKRTEVVLYDFKGGADGAYPAAGLALDPTSGALFGTSGGGDVPSDLGTVFKLTPPAPGQTQWTESVIYRFTGGANGSNPLARLLFDPASGSLYGTAFDGGGVSGSGLVFKLSPPPPGQTQWTQSVLHSFGAFAGDGANPQAGLSLGADGALYGTTVFGGTAQMGTVYRLAPPSVGQTQWTETILWSFGGSPDGAGPFAEVIFDNTGALYGTTQGGGGGACSASFPGCGTVFQLTPPGAGLTKWSEAILQSFSGPAVDGAFPSSPLILDATGALWGAAGGVKTQSWVFKLTPQATAAAIRPDSTIKFALLIYRIAGCFAAQVTFLSSATPENRGNMMLACKTLKPSDGSIDGADTN